MEANQLFSSERLFFCLRVDDLIVASEEISSEASLMGILAEAGLEAIVLQSSCVFLCGALTDKS